MADKLGVVSSARDEMDEMRSNLGFVLFRRFPMVEGPKVLLKVKRLQ